MLKKYYSLENRWENWREFLTYPQHVKPLTARLLDTLAEEIPYPQNEEDRYSALTDWLEKGYEEGLLTKKEIINLKSELGQQI